MNENQNDKLDEMLRHRRLDPASPDLAERIILKAQSIPRTQTTPLSEPNAPNLS
jgi:hypothetical protein